MCTHTQPGLYEEDFECIALAPAKIVYWSSRVEVL